MTNDAFAALVVAGLMLGVIIMMVAVLGFWTMFLITLLGLCIAFLTIRLRGSE